MKNWIKIILAFLLLIQVFACQEKLEPMIDIEEVSPWCIKGFDILDRTPEQRIELLKEMGFKKYGFNKGKGDYSQMVKEFNLATENNIKITSIFLWLNAKRDSLGKLSASNQELLNNLKEVKQKPTIWVSFSENYFKDLGQKESVDLSVEMIKFVKTTADELGCKLALYNHHGWFGKPQNQIEILKQLNDDSISMVYNFHHGHDDIAAFKEVAKMIKPYLSFVNINGMIKDGPKILDIGKGDNEYEMIRTLKAEGFNGPWGILGHIKTEDVQVVLKRNVDGLKSLNTLYQNKTEN